MYICISVCVCVCICVCICVYVYSKYSIFVECDILEQTLSLQKVI